MGAAIESSHSSASPGCGQERGQEHVVITLGAEHQLNIATSYLIKCQCIFVTGPCYADLYEDLLCGVVPAEERHIEERENLLRDRTSSDRQQGNSVH